MNVPRPLIRPADPGDVTLSGAGARLVSWLLGSADTVAERARSRGATTAEVAALRRVVADLERAAEAWRRAAEDAATDNGSTQAETAPSPAWSTAALTTEDTARMIGRSPRRVRQLVATGDLAARRVGRALLIDRDTVLAYLDERSDAA